MKNRITLIRSYTSMLWFDCLAWGACGEDLQKRRAVSNKIYSHLKDIYKYPGKDKFLKERAEFYAKNIADFEIGDKLISTIGDTCFVTDKTANSIRVKIISTLKQRLDMSLIENQQKQPIGSNDWYDMDAFNKKFKKHQI